MHVLVLVLVIVLVLVVVLVLVLVVVHDHDHDHVLGCQADYFFPIRYPVTPLRSLALNARS